jgi:L-iditol 2-dehydrogenase
MNVGVASGLGQLRCQEVPLLKPRPGKVLVRTIKASICGSDLHVVYMGWNVDEFPLAHGHPGHEGVGEVVDGGGTDFQPGDQVLTVPFVTEAHTFSEYQLIDPASLLRLSEGPPLSHLLMAQQLGTVIFASRKLPSLVGKTAVVLGQGSAGLFHDFVLRRLGAERIIVVEPVAERRAAAIKMGVDEAIDVTGAAATEAIMDLTGGKGADVVIEAVGSVETLNQSLHVARLLGQVVVFGLPPTAEKIPFDWDALFRGRLTLHAVRGAQEEPGLPDFRLALDYIIKGDIDVSPFATHDYPISRIQDAFDIAHTREDGALKVLISF